ncbi:unnamed protein product [Bursaphelenchus xylophilus]|uniref:(pine wood nematode) hypothetical protein n=1 Tax=Bursaphelenchus xylophilus TaxID=6326 RepID=A0A1I7RKP9_BURXY|nr:unnamed protein product [Bursaphelenchus xylophilus]CAG9131170.1 unnamed protein product [Bursaphelenchus xylophilus]
MKSVSNDVERVVNAIRAIQDIKTPQTERHKLTQALEALKEGPTAESIPIAFGLVTYSDRLIAHAGLNIVEDVIKFKWHEMSVDEKMQVRNGVLEWISTGNYSVGSVDLPVKTAASRVFATMMEHEWPENWPELVDQFVSIVENTKLIQQSHMIFLILRRLIEDVLTLITIQNSIRRKDLQNAINAHIGKIMKMAVGRLVLCVNEGSNEQSILLAKSAIELLSEIFDWVSGKDLEPFIDEIVDVLCLYLQLDLCGIYECAASSLHKLASRRRQKNDELPIVVSMFRDRPMQAILAACSLAARQSNSSEVHYKFLKALCDLLCSLGVHLSEVWLHITNPPSNFPLYLDALSEFFRHPSVYIRAEIAQVMCAFSSNDSIRRTAIVLERMPSFLVLIPKSLEKVGNINDSSSPTNFYSLMDYETEADFIQEHTRLRDRCFRMMKENMDTHFPVLSSLVTDWVNGRCINETENVTATEWDSMKKYITNYLLNVQQLELMKSDVDQWLFVLFNNVYNRLLTLSNPAVTSELLSIFSAFFVVLENHPEKIPDVISFLQQCLKLPDPTSNRGTVDASAILTLKRHSINLLLKLVKSLSSVITPYARQVLDAVVDVVPYVSALQKANLVQVLAALSNLATNPEEQQYFLENALRDNIVYFQSQEFLLCSKSVRDFFNYVGILSPVPTRDNDPGQAQFSENRLKLKSNLSAIEGALSHVNVPEDRSNPLFQLLLPVVRNIFRFVGCLNSIYSNEGISLCQGTYGSQILKMSMIEKQLMIYSASESYDDPTSISPEPVTQMRRFLFDIGDFVQNIIGLTGNKMSRDFYSLSDASSLIQSVFINAECVPDYRLRYWVKRAWSHIICHCPAERVGVVTQIACAVFQHIQGLLTDRWAIVTTLDQDGDVTEEELLQQQMVAVLSREFAEMLRLFVFGPGLMVKEDSKKHPSELMTPSCLAALKNATLLESTVLSICSLINCPDSKTVMRLMPVARTVFGTFHSAFDDQMAKAVLVHIIRSLQVNGSDEEVCGPLLGLSFSVYAWLRPNHPTLWEILTEVPESSAEKVQEFDSKIMAYSMNNENVMEKNKRDLMRKMLKPVIALKVGEQFRRTVPLRPIRRMNGGPNNLNSAAMV